MPVVNVTPVSRPQGRDTTSLARAGRQAENGAVFPEIGGSAVAFRQSIGAAVIILAGAASAAAEPMCFESGHLTPSGPVKTGDAGPPDEEAGWTTPVARLYVFAHGGEVAGYAATDAAAIRKYLAGAGAGHVIVAGVAEGEFAFSIPLVEVADGKTLYRFEDDGGSADVVRGEARIELMPTGTFVIRRYDDGSVDIAIDTVPGAAAGTVTLEARPYGDCRAIERVYETLVLEFADEAD